MTGWHDHVLLRGETTVKQGAFMGNPESRKWTNWPVLATQLTNAKGIEI